MRPGLALLLPLLLLAGTGRAGSLSASAPLAGILLVSVDTLRADHVGAYGGRVSTPALDALAARGVLVEQAFTPTPTTGPAHASLLTGLHPWRHGVLDNAVALDDRHATLAERLREAGWETAAFVSSYLLHERFAFARGFDHYEFQGTEGYTWRQHRRAEFWTRGEETAHRAMTWLTRKVSRGGAPFFVWVHFFDPHTPYAAPAGYWPPLDATVSLDGKSLPPHVGDAEVLRRLIRAYRGEVRYTDAQVGLLLERLHLLGIADRTAVVLTSDHGEGLGDHGVLEHGVNVYDELIRVPLLVRAPGLPAGRRLPARDGLAQLEDVAPTLLALAGVPTPPELDGVNLLPWLRGQAEAPRRARVLGRRKESHTLPDLYYVRDAGSKWIGPPTGAGLRHELVRDPGEREPAGAGPAPPVLRAQLDAAESAEAPRPAREVDPEVREALEALGYVD